MHGAPGLSLQPSSWEDLEIPVPPGIQGTPSTSMSSTGTTVLSVALEVQHDKSVCGKPNAVKDQMSIDDFWGYIEDLRASLVPVQEEIDRLPVYYGRICASTTELMRIEGQPASTVQPPVRLKDLLNLLKKQGKWCSYMDIQRAWTAEGLGALDSTVIPEMVSKLVDKGWVTACEGRVRYRP